MPPTLEKLKGHIAFGLLCPPTLEKLMGHIVSMRSLQNLLRYSFEISYMDSSSKNNQLIFFFSLDYPPRPLWSYAPFKGS